MKRRLALLALVAIAIVATFLIWRPDPGRPVDAQPAAIARRIVARAVVVPRDGFVRMGAGEAGVVRAVHVKPGDVVKKDAPLVTFRPTRPPLPAEAPKVDDTVIRADRAGTVLRVRAAVGEGVAPQRGPLVELADVSRLDLRIEVAAERAGELAAEQPVEVRAFGGAATLAKTKLARVGKLAEGRTIGLNLARVRAEGQVVVAIAPLNAPAKLLVGQELEAAIALPPVDAAVTLPRGAVVVDDGETVVWLKAWPTPRRHVVRVGASDAERIAVEGLPSAAQVVVRDR